MAERALHGLAYSYKTNAASIGYLLLGRMFVLLKPGREGRV
jgi:hypothetical protein